MGVSKEIISEWFMSLQDRICSSLEKIDGLAVFEEDKWERPGGGGGRTRIIREGKIFEKGGVNFSAVYGMVPDFLVRELKLNGSADEFFATGVSIVIHPFSPLVPVIHMNVRYFEIPGVTHWFGGGIDLTPIYVIEEDAVFFHKALKEVCQKFNPGYYPEFKKWADDYFFIRHRNETRGIGGIFFDHLKPEGSVTGANRWDFVKAVGESFIPLYSEIVKRHSGRSFSSPQKQWQLIRRGRYVEFNLVYDKGTRFGLETNGRAESILMSLPKEANWFYNHHPTPGSEEERTLKFLKKGIDWAEM